MSDGDNMCRFSWVMVLGKEVMVLTKNIYYIIFICNHIDALYMFKLITEIGNILFSGAEIYT